ncbi:MAG: PAC2 family protein [Acidimicrobiales bacterium]
MHSRPCVSPIRWRGEPHPVDRATSRTPPSHTRARLRGLERCRRCRVVGRRAPGVPLRRRTRGSHQPRGVLRLLPTRPLVVLDDTKRTIEWPAPEFTAAVLADSDRDLVVLAGIEPHLRWKTFANAVVEVAEQLGVSMVVSLGALIADVAHSRPTTVFGSAQDVALAERLDLEPSSYEGPTGIIGVLTNLLHERGIDTLSLWGSIPSYVPHANSPKAALALVDRLGSVLGLPILGGDLVEAAAEYEAQITALVEDDDDTKAYVSSLEAAYDASMRPESSAELIEELENFLRDQ